MRITLFGFLVIFASVYLHAQPASLIAYYSFDNCDAKDDVGNGSNGTLFGSPTCECGVSGQALRFDGIDDYVAFTGVVNNVFQTQDFTISFYFKALSTNGFSQQLLSKREQCNDNTALSIEFIQSLNFLTTELRETGNSTAFISSNSDEVCWHHCILIRNGRTLSLYLNGELKSQITSTNLINLTNNAPLTIGNSPCVNNTVTRFRGLIDELRIYNRALTLDQLEPLYIAPDKIANRDTVVFIGGSIETYVTNTCATAFEWSPTTGVTDPFSPLTTILPEDTTAYVLSFEDSDRCITYDTLHVNVIDPSQLSCEEVFLPKAFTPNGDIHNEIYRISNPDVIPTLISFEIFDRWGAVVFSTNNAFEGWDGSFRGSPLNPGVFIWKVCYVCDGQEKNQAGTVTLMR